MVGDGASGWRNHPLSCKIYVLHIQFWNFLGLPWHSSVISAARSRSQETASATPITLLSGVGTSICAQFMRGLAALRGACACAPPACAAVKWLRPRDSPPFFRVFPLQLQF